MTLPLTLLICALALVAGIIIGRWWEQSIASIIDSGMPERQTQDAPVITRERYKCGLCGEPVKYARHDGLWRCAEHKAV